MLTKARKVAPRLNKMTRCATVTVLFFGCSFSPEGLMKIRTIYKEQAEGDPLFQIVLHPPAACEMAQFP